MASEKTQWKKLKCNLSKNTLTALENLKFFHPTPIQIHAIPTFLSKKDIVAQAVTGSGKTLSFIIPIMELLNKANDIKKTDIFSIILSPTTELANQTFDMFNEFLKHYNGIKPSVNLYQKKTEIPIIDNTSGIVIISTPGKLAEALDKAIQGSAIIKSLKKLEVLVMDEADRLLEMGFSAQLQSIIKVLPKQRLTALFSATQTTEVEDLVRTGMRNPVRVSVKVAKGNEAGINDTIPSNLANYHLTVDCEKKFDVLVHFLKENKNKKVLVFFATCVSVDYFNRILSSILKKHKILCMHRKLKSKRNKIFQEFKALDKGVMLCTDVMARGIDIPNIDWVVQYDPPKCATNFVHRCGRTARCDQSGQTLLLLQPNEAVYLNFLTHNQNVQIDEYKWSVDVNELRSYHKEMQEVNVRDRLVYEKGIRAFVAYVEYYKKHELKYVFKLRDVDMGKLGNSFGLLRLPQMRELNKVDQSAFKKSAVDLASLIYKDKSVRHIKDKTREIKQEKRVLEEERLAAEGPKTAKDIKKEIDLKRNKRAVKRSQKAANKAGKEGEEEDNECEAMEVDGEEENMSPVVKKAAKVDKKISKAEIKVVKLQNKAEKMDKKAANLPKKTIVKKRKSVDETQGKGLASFTKKAKL